MMKKLLIALLLLSSPAYAQKSKSALTTEVNSNFASGTGITAATLRATMLDVINSYYDLAGGTSLACAAHQWVAGLPTLSSLTCTQPAASDLSNGVTGTGTTVLATSPTIVTATLTSPTLTTPALGTPASGVLGSGVTLGGVTMGLGSDATGDVYYNNGGVLTRLPKGTNGQALELVSGLPAWATLTGTGTVTSVGCGAGLGGGTITTTGTCTIDQTAWAAFTPSATIGSGSATFVVNLARTKTWGKVTFISLDVSLTITGGTPNSFSFSLPNTANSSNGLAGQETAISGVGVACRITAAVATATCTLATAASFTTGSRFQLGGSYENQ